MDFKNCLTTLLILLLLPFSADADWFDEIRDCDDKEALYRTLYYMPKGGDLHNHLSGAVFAEWWYTLALAEQERGYEYYTKVRIANCREYGGNAFAFAPYLLLFRNISALEYAQFDECEKGEYERLTDLDDRGMWDSTMTDEFYVAATAFRLSWEEIKTLSRNSLEYAFVADEVKERLLQQYNERIARFERQVQKRGVAKLGPMPQTRGFVCNRYQLCK